MATQATMAGPAAGISGRWADVGAAFVAALAVTAIYAAGGFASLRDAGVDNDSLLRLVQIRDLIGGQGWFDLHQYRMGLDGGFVIHWSRLVDAPIAAIILIASALTGSMAMGETVALVLWPFLLLCAALFFLLRAARGFAGDEAVLPALIVGAAALHYTGLFAPANIDHHNVQLVLTLAMLSLLLEAPARGGAAALAGACAALMLAIGMEAAPYVAVAGAAVAIWFLVQGAQASHIARSFGLAFALVAAAVFLTTAPAHAWFAAQCDAFSIVQFAMAAVGGAGLAAIAASRSAGATFTRRLAVLGGLALLTGALLLAFFPQCLADPYSGMDPRLKTYWLGSVMEAQPLWVIAASKPALAAGAYITAIIGALYLATRMSKGLRRQDALVAAFLLTAMLISVWQVRGSMFSIPLAVIPLSAWIAERRERAASGALSATAGMAMAWILSFAVTWNAAAAGLETLLAKQRATAGGASAAATASDTCQGIDDYAQLAAFPPTRVLAISNTGAAILRNTGHGVLAGPYHRNVAGNLAALSAFMEPPATAERIVRDNRIGLVALCPGNDESQALAKWAPDGFMAELRRGEIPAWLEPLAESRGRPLLLYRVLPPG